MKMAEHELPKTMKAAVMHRTRSIVIEEVPLPEIGPHEVLVKVMAVGICGSDLHYYSHGRIGPYVVEGPFILGHECAGDVAAVGSAVSRFAAGDRVAVEPGVTCGRCEACKAGRYNLCPGVEFLATPPYDGAFVQYIKIHEDFLFPIPDSLSYEEAALVEPFSVGIHAAARTGLQPGSTIAIMGMGPVGLMAVAAAKAYGAAQIIVTDLEPLRLDAAKRLGATHAVNIREQDPLQAVKEITGGRGVDVAWETAGNPKALQSALGSLRRGGKLAIVGLPAQDEIPLNVPFIADNEVDIYGIFRYANTYPKGIRFLSSGIVDAKSLITDRFALEQTQEAMERALNHKSECLKVIVYPNGLLQGE
ncbi:NAD(P)-dependent alcohol dehydrogenase [Paenibacillus mucilaginosus]|uniref:GutB2 n=1 Tax=Paenibacillus mucilaginosus (strain KNP414) TaxID=1036673 RepID=F8FRU2_PAEMK|nr:NAD(P)-dependent alcohol dehydrogenase [Paenibacillus mucilaginosus]AEI40649.1 GutB2 [Paenibacillus mucilaginosus KNP414]MCG7211863.1 NAD(P)-dependent alcohol dehydrogenase [Paenibacillus mucilaginosus]WDM29788.1 NAD(P)-dependent alcohol dehydrogenase [Paenibacillus mucilaginosus]